MPIYGVPTTRKRETAFPLLGEDAFSVDRTTNYISGEVNDVSVVGSSLGPPYLGTQVTESEGHPWPPPKGLKGDVGGDFFTEKKSVEGSNALRTYSSTERIIAQEQGGFPPYPLIIDLRRSTRGASPIYPYLPGRNGSELPTFPTSFRSDDLDLMELGATAISRCKPTNSIADLATALGEFYKDGIPKFVGARFWQDRTLTSRNAGDEYLNVEFGWKPLVSDIQNVWKSMRHAENILAQYERDAGRVVRRNYRFPSHRESSTQLVATDQVPVGIVSSEMYEGASLGKVYLTSERTRDVWFSGAFTYHLPSGYDSRNAMIRALARADRLFGLNLTPDLVWNLTPWSWAIDWFTNFGDVVSNVSDMVTDGLVMRYGYIMEHTVAKNTYTLEGFSPLRGSLPVPPMSFVTETKVRRAANPFGFGFTWDGLSPRQLAIAAALGLSKRK